MYIYYTYVYYIRRMLKSRKSKRKFCRRNLNGLRVCGEYVDAVTAATNVTAAAPIAAPAGAVPADGR